MWFRSEDELHDCFKASDKNNDGTTENMYEVMISGDGKSR
jgi:hypothetical protein